VRRPAPGPETTIDDALTQMAGLLDEADIDQARLEARGLLQSALGVDHAALIMHGARALGPDFVRVNVLLARRLTHEPLSRILGKRAFFGLDFHLNAATLDPRPDTETLVEAVLAREKAFAHDSRQAAGPNILDIGTGTGAILLALLANLPDARGVGVDVVAEAVEMARANATRLGLAGRATFQQGDCLNGDYLERMVDRFDVIVSNPPYIPSAEIETLEPEVRLHDPRLALDGGVDGFDFYRRLVGTAPGRLVEGGLLAFEVGFGQADVVAGLMSAAGFGAIGCVRDLGGIERVVLGVAPVR
jgi:release factor glutamine methyltransferase